VRNHFAQGRRFDGAHKEFAVNEGGPRSASSPHQQVRPFPECCLALMNVTLQFTDCRQSLAGIPFCACDTSWAGSRSDSAGAVCRRRRCLRTCDVSTLRLLCQYSRMPRSWRSGTLPSRTRAGSKLTSAMSRSSTRIRQPYTPAWTARIASHTARSRMPPPPSMRCDRAGVWAENARL